MRMRAWWIGPASLIAASACSGGGGGGGGRDFGEYEIALTEPCEGIPGLTGQSVLDQELAQMQTELGYITSTGTRVDLTPLTMTLTWPASPEALCYPPYEETGVVNPTAPRIVIPGLTLGFVTSDGRFAESLDAIGLTLVLTGTSLQGPVVAAVRKRGSLEGTWEPFEDYDGGSTLSFVSVLNAANPDFTSGNIAMRTTAPELVEAGIFSPGFAAATW